MSPAEGRGLPLRAFIPNAVTVLALCAGLTAIRYAFNEDWEKAMIAIVVAGVLDGLDGNIARMLKANSKFGAELDSLCDNIGFGTAPALILFQFSLDSAPKFGWTVALALAVSCALRLARFNARIDADVQPHKSAGFNTGVPAPVGAGLAFAPVYLWLITGNDLFRDWQLVMPWTLVHCGADDLGDPDVQLDLDPHPPQLAHRRLAGVALLAAALINEPWITLLVVSFAYLASVPFSLAELRPGQAATRSCGRADTGWLTRRVMIRTVTGRVTSSGSAISEWPRRAAAILLRLLASVSPRVSRPRPRTAVKARTCENQHGTFFPCSWVAKR